jgi:type II secretory pathway component HofQ
MPNRLTTFLCAGAALFTALTVVNAQSSSPSAAPSSSPVDTIQKAPLAETKTKPATPPLPTGPSTKSDTLLLVQATTSNAATSPAPATSTTTSTTTTTATGPVEPDNVSDSGGVAVREFQGDDVGAVLRLLARQAKINMVVSEAVVGTVTMRLEDVTALQAVSIIVKAKGLFLDKIENVYYIKTAAERTAEPTESDSYQFSYARAKETAPLIAAQLSSKDAPQVDERTNTLFFRETRGNIDNIRKLLLQIDKPTKQVMIEARLVEVTANPRQSYGINWGGVFGGSTSAQTLKLGGSTLQTQGTVQTVINPVTGLPYLVQTPGQPAGVPITNGKLSPYDFLFDKALNALGGQFAILSAPQLSVTLRALNEDSDAEFLAHSQPTRAANEL